MKKTADSSQRQSVSHSFIRSFSVCLSLSIHYVRKESLNMSERGWEGGDSFDFLDLHTNICTFCVTCKIDLHSPHCTLQGPRIIIIIMRMMMIWWSCAGHNNEANTATNFFFHIPRPRLMFVARDSTYEHVYRGLLSLHFWHLTSQHHSNLQLHETVRTSMSATYPRLQHIKSHPSVAIEVILHSLPCVPKLPVLWLAWQKSGDVSV